MLGHFAAQSDVLSLAAPAAQTATGNGTGVDLQQYEGLVAIVLNSAAGTGTTPTLDVKIQDSADNSSFADVAGAAFAQVTNAASTQKITINAESVRRYIRIVRTIGGTTPSFTFDVVALGLRKYGG